MYVPRLAWIVDRLREGHCGQRPPWPPHGLFPAMWDYRRGASLSMWGAKPWFHGQQRRMSCIHPLSTEDCCCYCYCSCRYPFHSREAREGRHRECCSFPFQRSHAGFVWSQSTNVPLPFSETWSLCCICLE